MNIATLAEEINRRSANRRIGCLQEIRKNLHSLTRLPARSIFAAQSIFDGYAFHWGGRTELQFNIGYEQPEDTPEIRYGVAFSLETSQTLPDIQILIPKVGKFNEFLVIYPNEFHDMRMWHYRAEDRSEDYMPSPIPPELIEPGVFVFLGKRQPEDSIDVEAILEDFDRLLPLYEFVEGRQKNYPELLPREQEFAFRPGHLPRKRRTRMTLAAQEIDIALRHNQLQDALVKQLVRRFGENAVGTEIPNGVGGKIDIVVKNNEGFDFYEIKIGSSARSCIRQALAQLLEYSFWPGARRAERLIVVGEPALDSEARQYLALLHEDFGIPIFYKQFGVRADRLQKS